MKQLNIYSVKDGDIPEEGMEIMVFSTSSSWGMFESMNKDVGVVAYEYPYDCDTLQEAYDKGYKLVFENDNTACDENGEWCNIVITVDEQILLSKYNWVYTHEYYMSLNTNVIFPFSTEAAIRKSIKLGIIELEKESSIDSIDQHGIKYVYRVMWLKYNGISISLPATNYGNGWSFMQYTERDV